MGQTCFDDIACGSISPTTLIAVTKLANQYAEDVIQFSSAGNVSTGTKKFFALVPRDAVITNILARLDTAPVGSTAILDVNKNGTTLFTTQGNRPTIADGGNNSTQVQPDVTTLSAGDRLSVDCDQIGSGTAGADLSIAITVKRLHVG